MRKKLIAMITVITMSGALITGCGGNAASTASSAASEAESAVEDAVSEVEEEAEEAVSEVEETTSEAEDAARQFEAVTITLFAAKSLNTVMEDAIIKAYNEIQPNVTVVGNYDSSGTLQTQIQEGAACDVFFSAAQKQMNELEEGGFVVEGTRANIVNNQVCVVTYEGSGTQVTGIEDLDKAANMALADGSVPVGRYTREALISLGILPEVEDAKTITTAEISEALGGLEINECANVGAVTAAVAEGSNEVGTVYYSDTYGKDGLIILQYVPYDLTGNVIYPAAGIVNAEADDLQKAAAADFVAFLTSDTAKAIFESYYFDVNV